MEPNAKRPPQTEQGNSRSTPKRDKVHQDTAKQLELAATLFNTALEHNPSDPLKGLLEVLDRLLDEGQTEPADALLVLIENHIIYLATSQNPPLAVLDALEEHIQEHEREDEFFRENVTILLSGRTKKELKALKKGEIDLGEITMSHTMVFGNDTITSIASPLINKIREAYELRKSQVIQSRRS